MLVEGARLALKYTTQILTLNVHNHYQHLTFHLGGAGSGDVNKHSGWGFGMHWNQNYHKFYKSPVTPESCINEKSKEFVGHYDYNYVMDHVEVGSCDRYTSRFASVSSPVSPLTL